MNTDPEEQFEQLLRTSLCAGPYVGSIANLPERAIAIARSRQATSARGDVAFWQHPTRRLVKWATLLASAAIVTIFVAGCWSLAQTSTSYGSRDSSAVYYAAVAQSESMGFTMFAIATVAIIVAAIIRSVTDAISADAFPVLSGADRAKT